MSIATGIYKQLAAKKQSGLGVASTGSGAQLFRRVTSTLNKKKAFYKSNEIDPSMQRSDGRHVVISVDGTINGELSVGGYNDFISSVLRSTGWTAAVSGGALTDVTAAVTSGANGTFTTVGANWLTLGFKIGMVVRWTGWSTTGVPNNAHNFLITALTTTVMTGTMLDGVAVGAKAAGDTVTALSVGKHNYIPITSHARDYWTIEHNHADIVQSEQFVDCAITGMNVKLPATGMATIDFPIMGLNMTTGTASVFTTPTAAPTGNILAAANGAVFVQGTKVATITSLDFGIAGNYSVPGGVVGSNVDPDVFPGMIDVSGNMSVLFDSVTMRDYFLAETEVSIVAAFTTSNDAAADVMAFTFPVCKINGADKDDGEKGLTMTMPFVALRNTAGGTGTSSFDTIIQIQDSAAI